jgi:hypothetical protein
VTVSNAIRNAWIERIVVILYTSSPDSAERLFNWCCAGDSRPRTT